MEEGNKYYQLLSWITLNKLKIGTLIITSVLMFFLLALHNLNNIEAEKDAAVSFEKMVDFLRSGEYFEAIEIAEKLQEREGGSIQSVPGPAMMGKGGRGLDEAGQAGRRTCFRVVGLMAAEDVLGVRTGGGCGSVQTRQEFPLLLKGGLQGLEGLLLHLRDPCRHGGGL